MAIDLKLITVELHYFHSVAMWTEGNEIMYDLVSLRRQYLQTNTEASVGFTVHRLRTGHVAPE